MSDTNLNPDVKPNDATPSAQPPVTPAPTVNVEDLLAKVRAEEKGKLYPEIEKLKADVNTKVERINSLLMSVAEKDEQNKALTKEIDSLKKQIEQVKEEGAKGKVDEKDFKELQDQVAKLTKEVADKDALIASIEAEKLAMKTEAENEAYRATKVKDLDESVQDLVFGKTKEEIDATYEKAKAAYDKLTNKLAKPTPNAIPKPGVSPHADASELKNLTPEQIRALGADPKAWAEFRTKIGLK